MRKKILKSLMLTLVSASLVTTGSSVTTFAAEIEEFSDSLDLDAEEINVDGDISDTTDVEESTQEADTAEEPEIEVQDPEEESETAQTGDGVEMDMFSDGESTTEEEMPSGGTANSFIIEGTVLKQYTGSGGQVEIPAGVTEIADYAFANCTGVQSVWIHSGVTKIGYRAFSGCTGLRTVTLYGVKTIGEYAFADCTGLGTVTLDEGLKTIGAYAFQGCTAMKYIAVPATVTLIDAFAFDGCTALKDIALQKGLLEIGRSAFSGSGLEYLTIPKTVTSVGNSAFQDCKSLKKVNVLGGDWQVGDYCFKDCENLQEIRFENGIREEIGYEAFQNCSSLGTITLPANITKIGEYAFDNCQRLKTNIPSKIKTIQGRAFRNCAALTTVTLPDTLTEIGASAFENTGITSVTIPSSVTDMGSYTFGNCENLVRATVYASAVSKSCFENCNSLQTVVVGTGVTDIQYGAFCNCTSLTSIYIASTVTMIGSYAFQDCSALSEIYFPSSVTKISDRAMLGCKNLKKAVIPESVTVLEAHIFGDSPNVTIYGATGSFAENYAKEYGIPFVNSMPAQPIAVTFGKDKDSVTAGDTVRLWTQALGGSGYYVYKFWISDTNNQNWKVLRDYGKSSTYTWTSEGKGKKHLYVDVKDSNGTVKRAGIVLEVKNNPLTASLNTNPSGNALIGSQVKLTAGAGGGSASYVYKFWISDANNQNWKVLRDYGKSNTYIWTADTLGKRNFYVDVKDGNGTVKRAGMVLDVRKPVTASLGASPSGSAVKGSQVKLTVNASGGTGRFFYKFWISDANNQNWKVLRDYGSSNAYIWTADNVGKKHFYVDVKDGNGTVKRAGIVFEVKNKALTASLSISPSGSSVKGSQVKLTANAGGGSGSFSYRFWISDANNQNWYMLRDYGKSSTYTWTTGIVGKKHLYVDVKDSSGTVKRAGSVFEVKNKALTANLSATPSGSAVSKSKVILRAKASGGTGKYTYKFLIRDAKGNWYKIRDFGTSSTCTWVPGTTGNKTLYVDVKDSNGTVKRASLSFKVR
ncbi:leucine-rich repeat protein [Blautia sp. MSJ-19]|uniref:leucine-rich repeat protein n=1 Tax=Blautia sp. MSJ-19 TaxID=2841517 RepID=UPI001C0EAEE8|nr:leucine-rich repeat protein [Blautia sp. MSJ-19]MBU5481649.1 leucine-rich repeat protein [Blautia sp. MSJ-19]